MSDQKPTAGPIFIDTHAHLDDDQFGVDVGAVMERAAAAGVGRIINIGYRPERWKTTLSLAERFPGIAFTFGLHPHHVDEWSPEVEADLRWLLEERRPIAVGEIGLDYFRNRHPPVAQARVFTRQLDIALEFKLPVVIHQRSASDDLVAILRTTSSDLVCVLHSFDGTVELAELAFERGYFLGAGGLMTRAGSAHVRDVLARAPRQSLVLETDAPYLVPAGVKERRNEPAYLPVIAEQLANLIEIDPPALIEMCTENAQRAFGPLLDSPEVIPGSR